MDSHLRINFLRFAAVLLMILSLGAPAFAQKAKVPTVVIMHAGVDRLLEDIEYLVVELAGEKNVWEDKIQPNFEVFLPGVDTKRPIRYDVLLDPKADKEQARPSFPILQRQERNFLKKNIQPLGITTRQRRRNLYSCAGAFNGWLQFNGDYATFAEQQEQIPANFDPFTEIEAPFKAGHDLYVTLKNDVAGMEARAAAIKPVRANLLAALKKHKDEDDAEFALRKLGVEQQLNELERFFVQAAEISITNNTDSKKGTGDSTVRLKALPETELEKSVKMLAVESSHFASLKIDAKSLANGRINFPLDDFRKAQLKAFYPVLRPVIAKKIDSEKDLSGPQKEAAKKAVDGVIDMLEQGIDLGLIDGFFESIVGSDKKHGFLLGVRAMNGKQADEIVKLIPAFDKSATLAAGFETVQGVALHKIEFKGEVTQFMKSFFGGESTMIVGTSEKTVWIAGGADAEVRIKDAIETVAKAEKTDVSPFVLEFSAEMQPLMKAYDGVLGSRGNEKLRAIALEAFSDGGRLEFDLKREGDVVIGTSSVDKPILQFIGELIADEADKQL